MNTVFQKEKIGLGKRKRAVARVFLVPGNGNITINITQNILIISNSSVNKELSKAYIYNRFYKTSNQPQGTGLGLAIVKAIVNLYDFKIEYSFQENLHSFKVIFH